MLCLPRRRAAVFQKKGKKKEKKIECSGFYCLDLWSLLKFGICGFRPRDDFASIVKNVLGFEELRYYLKVYDSQVFQQLEVL